jgi:lysozyme
MTPQLTNTQGSETNPASKIIAMLEVHEGLRLKTYSCTAGYNTIGIGRNLDTNPLSKKERADLEARGVDCSDPANMILSTKGDAYYLLLNDLQSVYTKLRAQIPRFAELSQVRQDVLADMAYNMGVAGLMRFKKMFEALETALQTGDHRPVVAQMLNSKWARQLGKEEGNRPHTLSEMMLHDHYAHFAQATD